jgi:hypothetical protein
VNLLSLIPTCLTRPAKSARRSDLRKEGRLAIPRWLAIDKATERESSRSLPRTCRGKAAPAASCQAGNMPSPTREGA